MKIGAIIFSRMSSTRLPGKALIQINKKVLIERVIERTLEINNIDHVCLSTSINSEDDQIIEIAKKYKIDTFRGSLNNVTKRGFNAANYFKYDKILRICGDRPFFNVSLYEDLISKARESDFDLLTNIYPRTVPPGLTGEIIKVEAIKKTLSLTKNSFDLEHVTRFIYKNPKLFSIENFIFYNNPDIIKLRLVVDDVDDLNRASFIAKATENLSPRDDFKMVIEMAKKYDNLNDK